MSIEDKYAGQDVERADGFDEEATLKELAALSLIEYGRKRKDKAKEIGVTAGLLDAAVEGYRRKTQSADDDEGSTVRPFYSRILSRGKRK